MPWKISSHAISLQGQDGTYIHAFGKDEYLCAVIDGHGEDRSVVDHVLHRLPVLCNNKSPRLHLTHIVEILAREATHPSSGACISLAYLHADGGISIATLGDAPALWGSTDFQHVTDLHGMAPHGIGCNIRERTRLMLAGAKIFGKYMLSSDGRDMLAVTRALGDSRFLPFILREPEYADTKVETGDFVLLCSDGFCDIQLPLSKTRVDWKHGVAQTHSAEQLVQVHAQTHGIYDDTSVIVAYRY